MPTQAPLDTLRELISAAKTATVQARELSYAARAWEALNSDDRAVGYQPVAWNDEAIAILHEGREALPDDPGLLQHAAIACHARAWDAELQQSPEAEQRWREALALWRALHGCSAFWQGMRARAAAMQPPVGFEEIDAIRDSIYEHLTAVHVSFVRFYCDQGQTERAQVHIRLVEETKLPPAVRMKMPGLLFEAMTGSLSDLVVRQHYAEAVAVLERFLRLYQTHLPALRQMAQLGRDWAATTSHRGDWPLLCSISRAARPWAERLAEHPSFPSEPLAKLDHIRLSECLGQHYSRKLNETFLDGEPAGPPVPPEHLEWCDDALYWLRALQRCEPDRQHAVMLANALLAAMGVHAVAGEMGRALAEQDERQTIMDQYPD